MKTENENNKFNLKKLMPFTLFFFFSIILIIPMMITKEIGGHDILYHFSAINALDIAYHKGKFFSRIYELTCQDYGYPSGIFYSMIPSGITVIIKNLFHIPAIFAIYIVLILVLFLSELFVYILLNYIFENKNLNLILSITYICFPYILSNIYVRFAYTEIFMTFLIPMIAIALYNLVEKQNYKVFSIYFVIGFTLSIMIHLSFTIYVTIISAIYLLLNINKIFNKKTIIIFFISSVFVIFISSSYWLPVLYAKKDINLGGMGRSRNGLYLTTIRSYKLKKNNFHLNISNIFLTIVFVIYILIFKANKKNNTKLEIQVFILYILTFFLTTPLCIFWKICNIMFLNMIQFIWRLYLLLSFFAIFAIEFIVRKYKKVKIKKVIFTVFLFIILISFYFSINFYNFYERDFNNNINYLLTSEGTGSLKNGDYYPIGATNDYIHKRNNEKMIIETFNNISEIANYQSKEQINFEILESNGGEIILNIPYSVCDGLKIYQYETIVNHRHLEIEKDSIQIGENLYLKLLIKQSNVTSKIILDYSNCKKLKQYLIENPFEFEVIEGDKNAKFKNFVKKQVSNYKFDFSVSTKTKVELPTLYYRGYVAKLITNKDVKNIKLSRNQNGFIQIEIEGSGTIHLKFEGKYILVANTISIISIISFAIYYSIFVNNQRIIIENKKSLIKNF